MWIANRLPACACAALLLGAAGRAHALSCLLPELVAPSHASVAVPTNTLIWCSGPTPEHGVIDYGVADGGIPSEDERSKIRVTAPDGTGVPGTQTRMTTQAFELFVFHPAADLAANSEYQVNCPALYAEDLRALSFTTGAGPASTAPALPDVSNVELNVATDVWGASHAVLFHDAVSTNSIVVIDLGGTQTLVPATPSGQVATARYHGSDETVWVGNGPCGGDWREAALGASVEIALGAFDLTGAFSGWTERRTYTLPSSYPASASPLPTPPSPEPERVADEDTVELDGALPASAPSRSGSTRDVVAPPAASSRSRGGCSLRTGHALRASAHDSPWGAAALLTALAGLSVRISRRSRRARRCAW